MSNLPSIVGVSPFIWLPLAVLLVITLALALFGKVPPSYITGNLIVRWRTTFMTALAFALVVGLLTVMLAFVNGMYALTRASGHPENVLILSEGATDEGFSNLNFNAIDDIISQPGIARLNDRPLVSREIFMVAAQMLPNAAEGRDKKRFLQIRGIENAARAAAVHEMQLYEGGQWFDESGVRASTDGGASQIEVVLGEGIAREMWLDDQPRPNAFELALQVLGLKKPLNGCLEVGNTFDLNERTWVVTGIMKSSGSTFDSEVWAKSSLVGPMFGKETYTTLVARAPGAQEAATLEQYFKNEYKNSAVNPQVETEYFKSLSQTNVQFLVAIAVVTFFMGIGGLFGIMNTMYASISQRIHDIGVLRLLGFRRRHILATFLLESVAISIVGGVLGNLIGMFCDGATATSIVSGGAGGKFVVLKLTVDAQIIAVTMALTLFMGLVGGLLPSIRAMRMTALETLR
jgi:ABC-type antimicrobial peptide transport system permease subunit